MTTSELKDVLVALIEKGHFYLGDSNESIGEEVAKFEKAYFNELHSYDTTSEIDTDEILV